MSGKPELSAAPGLQNVVVYVSNENFAQAYAVGPQNVGQTGLDMHHAAQFQNVSHSLASMGQGKNFQEKTHVIKSAEYAAGTINSSGSQSNYYNNAQAVISQNGFPQPVLNNLQSNYNNLPGSAVIEQGNVTKNSVAFAGNHDVLAGERQAGPGRPDKSTDEVENRDSFVESGYMTVMGADGAQQSVRCESVRSETAESSCSSLSSADDGLVVVQSSDSSEMLVYDGSVSVRPGGVVVTVGTAGTQSQHNVSGVGPISTSQPFICVPFGWKRLLTNNVIIYISPSNTALTSSEQVKDYLLTPGTCKCGLECPLKYESVFNFDPKVASKPWSHSPDTNTGDLTKLCNHKRKIVDVATIGCKPNDVAKLRKVVDYKKKKKKICGPYSVSQILAQREKLQQGQPFNKENSPNVQFQQQQVWHGQLNQQRFQQNVREAESSPTGVNNPQFFRYQGQENSNRGPSLIVGEPSGNISQLPSMPNQVVQQQIPTNNQNNPQIQIHHQQVIGPNGQVINVQGQVHHNVQQQQHSNQLNAPPQVNPVIANQNNGVVIQGQNIISNQQPQQRIYINGQPIEPSGPGRPNIQMVPVSLPSNRQDLSGARLQAPHNIFHQGVPQQFDPLKMRPPFNGLKLNHNPQNNQLIPNNVMMQQKSWQRMPNNIQQHPNMQPNQISIPVQNQPNSNIYERVPPLHQHTPPPNVWNEEVARKKVKIKSVKKRPFILDAHNRIVESQTPNVDVRQISNENNRSVMVSQFPQQNETSSSPSFMEDPSGYLAQQTALLNSTISRQTGANGCNNYVCNSPGNSQPTQSQIITVSNSQNTGVPLPSNMVISHVKQPPQSYSNRANQNMMVMKNSHMQNVPQQFNQNQMVMTQNVADSSAMNEHNNCQGCASEAIQYHNKNNHVLHQFNKENNHHQVQVNFHNDSRPNSQPSTPSSSGTLEDPVTSSTYHEKNCNQPSPDTRPIQGGTVSTSNVSPVEGSPGPSTPHSHSHTPTPPAHRHHEPQISIHVSQYGQASPNQNQKENIHKQDGYTQQSGILISRMNNQPVMSSSVVTTMASGGTVGSNTITSVLAGRANTATVSVNSPSTIPVSNTITQTSNQNMQSPHQSITLNVTKTPLEMVQSVVSSIQVPHTQQNVQASQQISPQQIIKHHSSQALQAGHILVSSGGQLIMASTGNLQSGVMAPPPPKLVATQGAMPPISVSPMITNVTAAVSQVIPAVAQQVLGQQTVLVNALPAPFVLQPGVAMAMEGMTVGQNVQIPQLVTGNVIQQQIQIDNSDPRRGVPALLSPETKKKGKKRKMPQTVASMLHIAAAQQNSGVMMSQQGFPQQIQMAHSPQGITTTPVMQALTIVPGKGGGPPQIVMNGQPMANASHIGTQQLITSSQPTQQINLLQPVNLLNGTTGMVQNFPTIQQFIVPNISGSMVMNADGTATILQDTSNLGMQLQLQNVNGQNVLTPVQNNGMFNGGQSILAAGPAGMVIRAPGASQGKLIQQQHSPGAQFLSPNGGQFVVNSAQFSGQLSPLVANVSPTQQVTFGTAQQAIRPSGQQAAQEYIQCNQMGQTLMVPCNPSGNISVSSSNQQNTTFVQQNTTIVQQQTTMVSNNQQLQNFQSNNPNNHQNLGRTINVDPNFIISNDKQPMHALLVQRQSPPNSQNAYRNSVSTQTAINQNAQSITTNTYCQTSTTTSAGSPPDTTTHSPLASEGRSPPTADTTTHTGSTDDGLSPAPSNCSGSCSDIVNLQSRQQSCSMAMVHCISSSEPDSADMNNQSSDHEWSRNQALSMAPKLEYTDLAMGHMQMSGNKKPPNPQSHMAYVESSTMVSAQYSDQMKAQEAVVSSRNYDKMLHSKRRRGESRQMNSSLFEDDDNDEEDKQSKECKKSPKKVGDLIFGPAKGCSAWPGKIIQIEKEKTVILWFGPEKFQSEVPIHSLQTLSEGLDAHHQARKKTRTSRKLSTPLEVAIHMAMAELDKITEESNKEKKPATSSKQSKKTRLRNTHR